MKTYQKDISQALQDCLKQIPFVDVFSIQPNLDLPGLSATLLLDFRQTHIAHFLMGVKSTLEIEQTS